MGSKIYTEEERKERKREAMKRYLSTENGAKMNRASYLISNYRKDDIKYGREIPDFDSKWVLENIFSKPCVYCGETDWHLLGCDRIDNSKGHIKDNVVSSCLHCNMTKPKEEEWKKKYAEKRKRPVIRTKPNGEQKIYPCSIDCIEDGYSDSCVRKACYGLLKTYMGCKWNFA